MCRMRLEAHRAGVGFGVQRSLTWATDSLRPVPVSICGKSLCPGQRRSWFWVSVRCSRFAVSRAADPEAVAAGDRSVLQGASDQRNRVAAH